MAKKTKTKKKAETVAEESDTEDESPMNYFHGNRPIASIPQPRSVKRPPDAMDMFRPDEDICYELEQDYAIFDKGPVKIRYKDTQATYDYETPPPPKPAKKTERRDNRVFSGKHKQRFGRGRGPLTEFLDEVWDRHVEREQAKIKEKFRLKMEELKSERKKNVNDVARMMVNITGPDWFQELSRSQMRAVDSLAASIKKDIKCRTTFNTEEVMARLGLLLRPNKNNIKFALQQCCHSPVDFLLILYEISNPNRTAYSINDRLMLSAVVHLTIGVTLRELHIRIPSPPPPPPPIPDTPLRAKVIKYESPYLEPLPEPVLYTPPSLKRPDKQWPKNEYFGYVKELKRNKIMLCRSDPLQVEVPEIELEPVEDIGRERTFVDELIDIEKEIVAQWVFAQSIYNTKAHGECVPALYKPSVFIPCMNVFARDETLMDNILPTGPSAAKAADAKVSKTGARRITPAKGPPGDSKLMDAGLKQVTDAVGVRAKEFVKPPPEAAEAKGPKSQGDLVKAQPESKGKVVRDPVKPAAAIKPQPSKQLASKPETTVAKPKEQSPQTKSANNNKDQSVKQNNTKRLSRQSVQEDKKQKATSKQRLRAVSQSSVKSKKKTDASRQSIKRKRGKSASELEKARKKSGSKIGDVGKEDVEEKISQTSSCSCLSQKYSEVDLSPAYIVAGVTTDSEGNSIKILEGIKKFRPDWDRLCLKPDLLKEPFQPEENTLLPLPSTMQEYTPGTLLTPCIDENRYCQCKRAVLEKIHRNLHLLRKTCYANTLNMKTHFISAVTMDNKCQPVNIIEHVKYQKVCNCMERFEDHIRQLEKHKQIQMAQDSLKSVPKQFIISGTATGPDGKLIYCINSVVPTQNTHRLTEYDDIIKNYEVGDVLTPQEAPSTHCRCGMLVMHHADKRQNKTGCFPICSCKQKFNRHWYCTEVKKNVRKAQTALKSLNRNFVITGCTMGCDGKMIYILQSVEPPRECGCVGEILQEQAEKKRIALMPDMPGGCIKYEIAGVHARPEGNVYILNGVTPNDDCSCMDLFKKFKNQHSTCLKLLEAYEKKMKYETEQYLDEMNKDYGLYEYASQLAEEPTCEQPEITEPGIMFNCAGSDSDECDESRNSSSKPECDILEATKTIKRPKKKCPYCRKCTKPDCPAHGSNRAKKVVRCYSKPSCMLEPDQIPCPSKDTPCNVCDIRPKCVEEDVTCEDDDEERSADEEPGDDEKIKRREEVRPCPPWRVPKYCRSPYARPGTVCTCWDGYGDGDRNQAEGEGEGEGGIDDDDKTKDWMTGPNIFGRYIILDKIPCDFGAQMDILENAMEMLAADGFPLAQMPYVHTLPHFKLWFQMRCKKYWTRKEKRNFIEQSRKLWEKVDKAMPPPRRPTLKFLKTQPEKHNWRYAKLIKRVNLEMLETMHRYVKFDSINYARTLFPTTYSYEFPNKSFRDVFFSYMPSKEEDIFPFRIWQQGEVHNMIDARMKSPLGCH